MAREKRPEDRQKRKDAVDKVQKALKKMVDSPNFKKALEDFEENPQAAQRDPRGFLQQRGVDLPPEAEVTVIERPGSSCWCIRPCILWWCWDICVCID